MDHLQEAMDWLEASRDSWEDGMLEVSVANTQFAIAHALIALAERLDKVIATDCEGKTGSISVDTG